MKANSFRSDYSNSAGIRKKYLIWSGILIIYEEKEQAFGLSS